MTLYFLWTIMVKISKNQSGQTQEGQKRNSRVNTIHHFFKMMQYNIAFKYMTRASHGKKDAH
jgi:hypothetical protein